MIKIGIFHISKDKKYVRFSQEKGARLYAMRKHHPGHVSSWQSRHEKNRQFGGAIFANAYIFSFSGLPELGDEAVMTVSAEFMGLITAKEAERIVEISNNPFYANLKNYIASHMMNNVSH